VDRVEISAPLQPDFNVAPTKDVYAVRTRAPRPPRAEDGSAVAELEPAAPVRQLRVLRWGLVPSWAKDPSIGSRLINARMETVADKSAFRRAFAKRRCLLPADGYYEWYTPEGAAGSRGRTADKPGKAAKQPFFIRPKDGGVLAMAGLYEFWRRPDAPDDDPDAWLVTCAVLTTEAEDAVGRIHDRMPLLVEPQRWAAWLDPTVEDVELLRSLLVPAAPGRLDAFPVSTRVNSVANNGPDLVEPLPTDDKGSIDVSGIDASGIDTEADGVDRLF